MKIHDFHVFMQRLLPFAFAELLPTKVHEALAGNILDINLYIYAQINNMTTKVFNFFSEYSSHWSIFQGSEHTHSKRGCPSKTS